MKKVGIFTYMLSNYGAVLQCYALQTYIKENLKCSVEVVDFTTEEHLNSLSPYNRTIKNPIKRFVYNSSVFLHHSEYNRRIERTFKFKCENIQYTRRYSSQEEVLNNPPREDIYISGSDQVFNLNSDYYKVYYLAFNKGQARKVAYAPSFGHSNLDDAYWSKIAGYINDFDSLSAREDSGALFLENYTKTKVPVVVDPTMLLGKDHWLKVATEPKFPYDYIFIYDLNGGEKLVDIAQTIKNRLGLKIVCLTSKPLKRYKVDKQLYDAGPSEFLGLIAKSKYVITDSFHGTVFSLLFSKPFFTYIAIKNASTRITSLLSSVGLTERILTDTRFDESKIENNVPNIDFDSLTRLSKDYLKSVIV